MNMLNLQRLQILKSTFLQPFSNRLLKVVVKVAVVFIFWFHERLTDYLFLMSGGLTFHYLFFQHLIDSTTNERLLIINSWSEKSFINSTSYGP